MKGIKRVAKGIGKAMLAVLGGIFFPVLIWVALGVAINQKLMERRRQQVRVSTIGELLEVAEHDIQREVGKGQK
jgi:hypothetical protein